MKTLNTKPPGLSNKATGIATALTLLAMLLPGIAAATTASNAVITNTVDVDYDDTGGNPQTTIQASVSVTVNLVTAHPTLSAPADNSTSSGVAVAYTYTIDNNSNGLDTYNLTAASNLPQPGITSQTHVFCDDAVCTNPPITSIDLGATTLAAASNATDTSITVPNDGTIDGVINGIAVGDFIVIGTDVRQVTAITEDGGATEIITFGVALTAGGAAAANTQVGERGTFFSVTTPIATVNNSTYDITVTAQDGVTAGPLTGVDTYQTTVLVIALTVTKYVQNTNTPGAPVGPGSIGPLDTGLGAGPLTYYDGGITANPGETLEYVIVITNGAGAATAMNVIISDPVPAFTVLNGNVAVDPGTGVFSNVDPTLVDNGDFAETDGTTVYIYAGAAVLPGEATDTTGGVGNGTGGQVPASATTRGAFQVTIQ